jgi:ribosome modulation factor
MQIEKDNPLENLQNTGQKTAINNRTEEKCPKVPNTWEVCIKKQTSDL